MNNKCIKCLNIKDISEFYKGIHTCKICYAVKNKDYRISHLVEFRNYNRVYARKYQSSKKGLAQRRIIDKRKRTNPHFKASSNISRAIRLALGSDKNGRSWESLVGYTRKELCDHLESQFKNGMSWGNYGKYWHIDHINPRSKYAKEQVKECWALSNLRPLEAGYNIKKSNYFEVSFNNFIKFV